MKIKKILPTILFFSIILLLPMTWYKNAIVNPNTYAIEDMTGFDAFNMKYPLIHCYILSFIFLINSLKYKKSRNIAAFMIGAFCLLALIFPVCLEYSAFSKLHLTRLTVVIFIVIVIALLTDILIFKRDGE
jgi:hypothetical protein